MIKTIAISCVSGVFVGVGISYLAHTKHKPEVVTKTEVKTETQTVYEQLPAKVVYKDKVRTIKMDCPSVKVADTKETVVRQASVASVPDKTTSVKVSIYPDWYNFQLSSSRRPTLLLCLATLRNRSLFFISSR